MDKPTQYTRWDAVVPAAMPQAVKETPSLNADGPGAKVAIRVWLYGGLAPIEIERPICLTLETPLTIRDVVHALQQRLDPCPTELMLDSGNELSRHCRLFINGVSAHRLDAPISASAHATEIEMILLTATEGG